MSLLSIAMRDPQTYVVTVQGRVSTTHTVTVAPDYAARQTAGRIANEELVRLSFEFLLEREPNTSILPSFALSVIGRYFPEYESTIQKRIG